MSGEASGEEESMALPACLSALIPARRRLGGKRLKEDRPDFGLAAGLGPVLRLCEDNCRALP